MARYLGIVLIVLHRQLLMEWWLLLLRFLLTKCGRYVGYYPNDINMSGVNDVIRNYVLILIPISWFFIAWASILGVFLVNFDDTILDEPLFEFHLFSLNILVCL